MKCIKSIRFPITIPVLHREFLPEAEFRLSFKLLLTDKAMHLDRGLLIILLNVYHFYGL